MLCWVQRRYLLTWKQSNDFIVVVVVTIPLAELRRGARSRSSRTGRTETLLRLWLSEGTVDLQPFFTETALKKKRGPRPRLLWPGPFFYPPPQGPADLTDIAGINQTFEGRIKRDGALRDGATAPGARHRGPSQKKYKLAQMLVISGFFSNKLPGNNHHHNKMKYWTRLDWIRNASFAH